MSDNPSVADPFGRIADEFVAEFRAGRRPSVDDYARRYPEFADDIKEILPALVLMERAKSVGGSIDGESVCAHDSSPLLGKELGDYRIIREVGRGGMGIVYEAEQVSLGRRVALKVLAKQALLDSKQRRRFDREAKAAARLHHTNIVPVFGVGEAEGLCYYAMQFIRGLGLDKVLEELKRIEHDPAGSGPTSRGELRIARRTDASAAAEMLFSGEFSRQELVADDAAPLEPPLLPSEPSEPPERFSLSDSSITGLTADSLSQSKSPGRHAYWQSVAQIGVQVAEALHYAHDQGVTHRDVKPSNLLFDLKGTVWVTDFGLAKSADHQNLTRSGDILGTIRYLPPEAFAGKYDARGDIYSLGLTLYELVALRPAFAESDRGALVKKVTSGEPNRLENFQPSVPKDLATIIHKALEREPTDRYQTAQQLADDLHRFLRDEPIQARRASLLEQSRRWSRRNPALAFATVSIASLVLVIACGAIGVATYYRHQEEVQRTLHEEAHALVQNLDLARAKAEEQEQITRRHLYSAQMSVAHQSWTGHRGIFRTQMILDQWRPRTGEPGSLSGGPDLRGWEWYYIHSLCHREQAKLMGHSDAVTCVAYSPAGSRLASVARDGTVRIWNTKTQECELKLTEHSGRSYSVVWSPNGEQLASAADDGVMVWEAQTGELLKKLPTPSPVFAVAFAPNNNLLAGGIKNGPVKLWSTHDWEEVRSIPGHFADLYTETISFSPDSALLAVPSTQTLTIHAVETGEKLHVLTGHGSWVQAAVFSPDGGRVASTSRDATIRVWDVKTGEMLQTLVGHTHGVATLAWHPKQPWLASAAWDGTCRVWNLETEQELYALRSDVRHFFSIAWHPDGNQLATASDDNQVRLWSPELLRDPAILSSNEAGLLSFTSHPSLSEVVTSNSSGDVVVWDIRSGHELRQLSSEQGPVAAVACSPLGDQVSLVCNDGSVLLRDLETGEFRLRLHEPEKLLLSVAWNHQGTALVTVNNAGAVAIWNAATGEKLTAPSGIAPAVLMAQFSPDGTQLAAGSAFGTIQIIELATGKSATLKGHQGRINSLSWNHDGTQLATAADDRTARLWNVRTGDSQFVLNGHGEVVVSVAFSPDGQRLLTGDSRGTIKLWDSQTGADMLSLRALVGKLTSVGWSGDGRQVAVISNGKLLIWDARNGFESNLSASPRPQ